MGRGDWTDQDIKAAHRLWAVVKHGLADPEILPLYLRDASRDPHWHPRPPKPKAPKVKDDDPSPAPPAPPVPVTRDPRQVGWAIAALVVSVCVIAGLTIRSLMGAP